jgi:hypothetical protein
MGNSTPYSQRARSNRPRSDTGIKECRSTPKGVGPKRQISSTSPPLFDPQRGPLQIGATRPNGEIWQIARGTDRLASRCKARTGVSCRRLLGAPEHGFGLRRLTARESRVEPPGVGRKRFRRRWERALAACRCKAGQAIPNSLMLMPPSAAIAAAWRTRPGSVFAAGRAATCSSDWNRVMQAAFGIPPIAMPMLNQRPQDHRIDTARKALTGR